MGNQQFILAGDYQTGIGDLWVNRHDALRMNGDEIDTQAWANFVSANRKLRRMYDDRIGVVCGEVGDIPGCSVSDTACNSCFFPLRFMERGAGADAPRRVSPKNSTREACAPRVEPKSLRRIAR